jgi:hypothetical protein
MADEKEHGTMVARATNEPGVDFKGHARKEENLESVERVLSPDEELNKNHMDYNRVDPDIAKYATTSGIEISDSESKRLKKLINKRVLTVMVFTYFLQALDKGTMSFASIMHIRDDLHLVGQQVR